MIDFEWRQPTLIERIGQAQLDALHPRITPPQGANYAIDTLAPLDDFDQLPGRLDEPEEGDGLLKVANAAELAFALSTTNEFHIGSFTTASILDKLEHERQHAAAAVSLGLQAIHALRFKLLADGNLGVKPTTIPIGEPVTKLGFAAMIAHPRRLSASDHRKLQFLGYRDVQDIAARIELSGQDIPLPLSIR